MGTVIPRPERSIRSAPEKADQQRENRPMSSKPIAFDEFASRPGANHDLRVVSENSTDMSAETLLKSILADVLGLEAENAAALNRESGLFGHMPELDSMAVAGLLTEIEDRFGIEIEDDDVDGEMLETFGGLLDFVVSKTGQD
jgi:acyl carrier protein